jgi:hypothetical protein
MIHFNNYPPAITAHSCAVYSTVYTVQRTVAEIIHINNYPPAITAYSFAVYSTVARISNYHK